MSTYGTVTQLAKMLDNMLVWLDKADEHATKKSFDANTLLAARLAPDQYPLVRQLQAATDAAKFAAARLAGKEAPKHPDTEQTIAEIRIRVRAVVEFIRSFKEADFVGGESRMVPLSFMPGKGLTGADYLDEMAVPNFYFHAITAYAILRANGVDVGKAVFIGSLNLKDVPAT